VTNILSSNYSSSENRIVYDGSFPGLFTVLYDIYLLRISQPYIRSRFEQNNNLFSEDIKVITDFNKSEKVLTKLKKLIGSSNLKRLYKVFLSENHQAENWIIHYSIKAIDGKSAELTDFSDPIISNIEKTVKMVSRESHRMEAFVRFKEIDKGHYFAKCTPDFDVLPLIITHFKTRYQDQVWTIYDSKRRYGIHYNMEETCFIKLDEKNKSNDKLGAQLTTIDTVSDKEEQYESLWKTYFDKVNIKSRKNTKLFIQHMPKRYWKYLSELH